MKKTKIKNQGQIGIGSDFFDRLWEESWTYIKTVVDVVREPILILDRDLCVMAANEAFYSMFQVEPSVTERVKIYELGNGQWDIHALRTLLEDILPHNTFFKGFEVAHTFPTIGRKVMILNARQIHRSGEHSDSFPPIIMLALEDVTEMIDVAETLARHTNQFAVKIDERTLRLESDIRRLEADIILMKKGRKSGQ